jgi:hypothetical protein
MVKSEGFLVPPLVLSTLVITLKKVLDPGGVVGISGGPGRILSFWARVFFFAAYP